MCAAAVRAERRNTGESSDRECSDGLKSRLAVRFADSGAKRRCGRRRRSTSFCAAEASVRVPLDSLRTCERKCRRLNARGRPSFNCLPLVTRLEEKQEEEEDEKGGRAMCARVSLEKRSSCFFAAVFCRHRSHPTANLS